MSNHACVLCASSVHNFLTKAVQVSTTNMLARLQLINVTHSCREPQLRLSGCIPVVSLGNPLWFPKVKH